VTAVAAILVALGFAFGSFGGFLLVHTSHLFAIPIGLVMLAVGLLRGGGLTSWARWIPVFMAGVGLITYGFHAMARDIWDPADAIVFIVVGVGWLLLGAGDISLSLPWTGPGHADQMTATQRVEGRRSETEDPGT
jgi:hypothetical protein